MTPTAVGLPLPLLLHPSATPFPPFNFPMPIPISIPTQLSQTEGRTRPKRTFYARRDPTAASSTTKNRKQRCTHLSTLPVSLEQLLHTRPPYINRVRPSLVLTNVGLHGIQQQHQPRGRRRHEGLPGLLLHRLAQVEREVLPTSPAVGLGDYRESAVGRVP